MKRVEFEEMNLAGQGLIKFDPWPGFFIMVLSFYTSSVP